jgi:hypothetical protein
MRIGGAPGLKMISCSGKAADLRRDAAADMQAADLPDLEGLRLKGLGRRLGGD